MVPVPTLAGSLAQCHRDTGVDSTTRNPRGFEQVVQRVCGGVITGPTEVWFCGTRRLPLRLHHPPSSQTPAESKDTNENKQQRGNLALVFTSKSFPMGLFSPLRTCHSSPTWTLLAGAPFPRNARDSRARKEAMAPGSSTPGSARPRSLIVGTGVS